MWPENGGAGSRTRYKPHIAALILLPYKKPSEWFCCVYGAAIRVGIEYLHQIEQLADSFEKSA